MYSMRRFMHIILIYNNYDYYFKLCVLLSITNNDRDTIRNIINWIAFTTNDILYNRNKFYADMKPFLKKSIPYYFFNEETHSVDRLHI